MADLVQIRYNDTEIIYEENGDNYIVFHVLDNGSGPGISLTIGNNPFVHIAAVAANHPGSKILTSAPLTELLEQTRDMIDTAKPNS